MRGERRRVPHLFQRWHDNFMRQTPYVKALVTIIAGLVTIACGVLPSRYPMMANYLLLALFIVGGLVVMLLCWELVKPKSWRIACVVVLSIALVLGGVTNARLVRADAIAVYPGFATLYEKNAEKLGKPIPDVYVWAPVYQGFHEHGEVIYAHSKTDPMVPPIVIIPEGKSTWLERADSATLHRFLKPGAIEDAYKKAHLRPPPGYAIPPEGMAGVLLDPQVRDSIGFLSEKNGLANDCVVSAHVTIHAQRFENGMIVGPLYIFTGDTVVRDAIFFNDHTVFRGKEYEVEVPCKQWHRPEVLVSNSPDY